MANSPFSETVQSIFAEFIPICQQLAGDQRYAISVGGSLGKGTWDSQSDVDFRLFTDHKSISPNQNPERFVDYFAAIQRWKEKGINIDGVWWRTVGEIDAAIDSWFSGDIRPGERVWTIWGYYILTDINNQYVIEDPSGIIAAWKDRLKIYPPALKQAILAKNLASLRYWRTDYHYAHKVERADVVFLAGISSKLVHEVIQILFALNETYYVGDGSNLRFIEKFKIAPANFSARVRDILYPQAVDIFTTQYNALTSLIDEVISLAHGSV
jgi:hypothetical protein